MIGALKQLLAKMAKPLGLLDLYHLLFAFAGALSYGFPSKKMVVIGVTGTKGKSTVLELINAGLEEAGKKTVLSSSVRFKVGGKSKPNSTGNTMPGRAFLQKLMAEGVREKCEYALLEVVSEGVVQHRHRFIDFDAAVFVNLHPEHIESHGSFEKYREAKLKFFKDVERNSSKKDIHFFVNQDDENANYFIKAVKHESIVLTVKTNKELNMRGEFNLQNAGIAEAVLRHLGVAEGVIEKAFRDFKGVPGRMEVVQSEPFGVVVDYAHTPDSLEAVYASVQKIFKGDLICVFGSMGAVGPLGGRDKWKRPKLGEIASKYCRNIILTDEDPVDEEPIQILEEIEKGIPEEKKERAEKILDRRQAIARALKLASGGDVVIITGKGSEPYIRVAKGKRIPWSDVGVVKELLDE
ncbi:MAG: UDP-N-acetylmuramoyl-L-alanyl-D-glutamate--2,6-diaminopimelate ligase [Patescibacteria group bacterium]|nr:UDP-N-acetylmuramoyl-L-alanyl-D-glutamate--2,6-diaminopimelate ligase [Patescibacteria group bacterium]